LNRALWVDENLIVTEAAEKIYAERPHLTVEIKEWLE